MSEEIELYLEDANERMDKTNKHLESELLKIRAGKASPVMLDAVFVDYYGQKSALSQVANVNTPDAKTIVVQPWDKSMMEPIEKAIMSANLGFNPINNGDILRIIVPPLTEERRRQLAKQVRNEGENTKVSIRNIRRDTNEALKKLKKDGTPEDEIKDAEDKIQKMTDSYIKKVDEILEKKEKDIMSI
ncbi:MAG: ribosome recycling factor [Bacteroidetes bacterium HGW-Bacteroidetes-21]|jgi:ribosome recycling factor|nr:MAG: ribosome recycling factor [Bacteroidetes bacterium HGW-Bacteroidetes-21]